MGNHFRPISEKSSGELLVEKALFKAKADIRKYEDEALVLKERLSGLYELKSTYEYILETIIEDNIPQDEDEPASLTPDTDKENSRG